MCVSYYLQWAGNPWKLNGRSNHRENGILGHLIAKVINSTPIQQTKIIMEKCLLGGQTI